MVQCIVSCRQVYKSCTGNHGVPQGTVLSPLLFLITIIDIDKGISPSSKLVSLADDTRVYSCINDIEKCDQLQIDLNSVYDWAHVNNMFLMPRNLIMYHLMVL